MVLSGNSNALIIEPYLSQAERNMMEKESTKPVRIRVNEMADFILDVGVFLMASGAHSGRINRNCERIARHWGYDIHISPNFTGMLVTVRDKEDVNNAVTRYKASPASSIHLEVLTLISHLSWQIAYGNTGFDEARQELERIRMKQNYPFWLISLAVGISCALLCTLAGGNHVDAAIAFLASSAGYVVRHQMTKSRFNLFLSLILAAFTTSMIAGIDTIWSLGLSPETSLATSVLYLVPGVPLLNSVIDLLEGYFPASIARSLFAASVLFCIAAGMTISIMLLGISNF